MSYFTKKQYEYSWNSLTPSFMIILCNTKKWNWNIANLSKLQLSQTFWNPSKILADIQKHSGLSNAECLYADRFIRSYVSEGWRLALGVAAVNAWLVLYRPTPCEHAGLLCIKQNKTNKLYFDPDHYRHRPVLFRDLFTELEKIW